ncbi:hypothetical protein PMAYCL1PPCAC_08386, partial [Pristionchus mayeri]
RDLNEVRAGFKRVMMMKTKMSSIASPCASPVLKKRKILKPQEEQNKNIDDIDLVEYSMVESLQWKARPAFDRIFAHLRTDKDCD